MWIAQVYRGEMTQDGTEAGWVPDACTLPVVEQPLRIKEFDTFFQEAVLRVTRPLSTRLDLAISPDAEATGRDLAQRESACCSFFGFEFERTDADLMMRITVPDTHVDVLDAVERQLPTRSNPHTSAAPRRRY